MKTISKHPTTQSIQETTPVNPADVIYINPPPAEANIPSPPAGFNPPEGTNYHSVRPKKLELTSLPDAVAELQKFTDFQSTLGKAAPPYQQVLQMFDTANQWSTLRDKAAAWDIYCAVMEGVVWKGVREQMDRVKPIYTVALRADPSLGQKYPQLTRLLEAKTAIAKKAATTVRANKQAKARGEPETHGAIGKKRQRAANRAALAVLAAQNASTAGSSGPAATTPPTTTTQTTAPAPQPAPAPVVVVTTPAPAATPAPVVNGANGVNGSNGINGANGVNGAAQHS